jgi:hypothetical protein
MTTLFPRQGALLTSLNWPALKRISATWRIPIAQSSSAARKGLEKVRRHVSNMERRLMRTLRGRPASHRGRWRHSRAGGAA